MFSSLRSGDWLTGARLRAYPLILLAALTVALVYLVATSDGKMDRFDRPLGTDFSQVYTAGVEVLEGHATTAYDNAAHAQRQRDIFGDKTQFYGWHYPPYFLMLAAGLARLPYLSALLVWQGATLLLYLASIGAILRACAIPRSAWLVPALAFPAVFVNLGHGHNGFLTAALLTCALLAVNRRPWLAGFLFGLLAYKPQFAVVLPAALLAGGYWRSLTAAALTVAAMTAATVLWFGIEIWQAFLASLPFTREVVLEQGSTGFEKIQTVFAAVRLVGGSVAAAYAVQTAATLLVLACVAWIWRCRRDCALKAAALLTATLLTTPYALDYDMMVLGPAIAFLVARGLTRGFAPFAASLLALVWITPLIARPVGGLLHVPCGLLITLVLFAMICRWSLAPPDEPFAGHPAHA